MGFADPCRPQSRPPGNARQRRSYWVHRKGAQSAAAGEPGIIPGSMGTASFHVTGRGTAASLRSSSSHGAGRALSRGEAAAAIGPGQLAREMRGVWFDHRHANRLATKPPRPTRTSTPSCGPSTRADPHRPRTETAAELQRIVRLPSPARRTGFQTQLVLVRWAESPGPTIIAGVSKRGRSGRS